MTTSGIYDSLTVYGAHAIGAGVVAAGVCKLAKTINDYCSTVETSGKRSEKTTKRRTAMEQDSTASLKISFSKYLVPALGLCAGLATTWWIATSPKAQYVAISMARGALMGEDGKEAEAQFQLLVDTIGPRFSSLPSLLFGAAGTALSCWMFGKIS